MKLITYLVGDYSGPEHLEKVLTSVQLGSKLHAFQMIGDHLHKNVHFLKFPRVMKKKITDQTN